MFSTSGVPMTARSISPNTALQFRTRRRAQKSRPILRDRAKVWAVYDDIDFDTADFAALGDTFGAAGQERIGRVGLAYARLMRHRELVDFAVRWMERSRPPA
jgi:aminoglycoside 3-N-acetyltransferase